MAQAIAMKQGIEQFGPYGSQLPENHSFRLAEDEFISEVHIRHGYIVDAIGFVVAKPDGSTYTVEFGGNKGTASKIVLRDGEYVTRISGTYGNYIYQNHEIVIGTIKIYTNLNPDGFGPYGLGEGETHVQEFTSPQLTDGPVVGAFARHDNYLESIGVFIRTEFPK